MSEIRTLGLALKSTVTVMGDLGSIGEEVLAAHDIKNIDITATYPGKLRQEIHEAAYRRFGAAALLNFGFAMYDDYSFEAVNKAVETYWSVTQDTGPTLEALDAVFQVIISHLDASMKRGHQHDEQVYGVTFHRINPLVYGIQWVTTSLPHHEAFAEGIIHSTIVRFISSDWQHDLVFHADRTTADVAHSTFHWTLSFQLKSDRSITCRELITRYELELKETLLKNVLEDANRSLSTVMSSVKYASRLQRGQLPRPERIQNRFTSFATLWEPRDTIGGDLYWLSSSRLEGPFVLSVVDCTGHGVPGAMLSLLVSNLLERIYAHNTKTNPAEALLALDDHVRRGLNQDQKDSESDDGCDAAILRIDPHQRLLEYAGAKIGLLQVSAQGLLTRHSPARCSLGYQEPIGVDARPQLQTIPYQPGDVFALVSDGITDQVGGPLGKRSYGYRQLEATLTAQAAMSANDIIETMKTDFAYWQGNSARRDDVTAVVFKV